MGISVERVVNQNSIIHFKCSICTDLVDDVHMLWGCRHTFCKTCITGWHTSKAISKHAKVDCPDCRKPFVLAAILKPTIALVNCINDIKLKCTIEACTDVIRYVDRTTHGDVCQFSKVTCNHCKDTVTKKEFNNHKDNCLPSLQKQVSDHLSRVLGGSGLADKLNAKIGELKNADKPLCFSEKKGSFGISLKGMDIKFDLSTNSNFKIKSAGLPVDGAKIYLETEHMCLTDMHRLKIHIDLDKQVDKIAANWNIKLTWRNCDGNQEVFKPNVPCFITKSQIITSIIKSAPENGTLGVCININAWDKTAKPSRKRQRSENPSPSAT